MYKRKGHCAIDAVYMAELEVKQPDPALSPQVKATMVYMNTLTGFTLGSVPMTYPPANVPIEFASGTLSQKSLNLLEELKSSLEVDFGKVIFELGELEAGAKTSNNGETDQPMTGLGATRE